MESGQIYQSKIFIDATYEGDLMATAGVSYTVGRESNSQYGESLNGVQANNLRLALKKTISMNAAHHNFIEGVDPYIKKGDPKWLTAFYQSGKPELEDRQITEYKPIAIA